MKPRILRSSISVLLACTPLTASELRSSDWPSFRGPQASGVAEGYPLPERWSVANGDGVRWKVSIPGLGHSSPVVVGELVCVTTAISSAGRDELRVGLYGDISPVAAETSHRFEVRCLDKRTGAVAWTRTAHVGVPRVKRHPKSSHANPTLASDGSRLVALFGSEGLFAYDLRGAPLWKRDLGLLDSGFFQVPDAQWGFASSPVIHAGRVIVQADVQRDSFLAAFDARTGQQLWRTPRADVPTWSTPTVHEGPEGTQILLNGWKSIGGYEFETGFERWRMRGGGDIPVPTPVVAHGLAFITNAHGGGSPIYAIRTAARGELMVPADGRSSAHVAWSHPRDGAYMQTPIVYGDLLYVCRDNGVLGVYRARTGERLAQLRLGDGTTGFSASAVAGDGKLYYTSEEGDVFVLKADARPSVVARSTLGEVTMATPAVSEGVLYFRTRSSMLAIATPRQN